jgi:hypothetical protein
MRELAVAHLIYVQHRDNDWADLTEAQVDAIKTRIWDAHKCVATLAVTNHVTERATAMSKLRSEG